MNKDEREALCNSLDAIDEFDDWPNLCADAAAEIRRLVEGVRQCEQALIMIRDYPGTDETVSDISKGGIKVARGLLEGNDGKD